MKRFYVICPVGTDPDFALKKKILHELGSEYELEPFFPLERNREFDVFDATTDLRRSEFVVADLSLERPSCYFELGMAQALGCPVATVAAAGTRLHQFGRNKNDIVFYEDLVHYRAIIAQIVATTTGRRSLSSRLTVDDQAGSVT